MSTFSDASAMVMHRPSDAWSDAQLAALDRSFAQAPAPVIIEWAVEAFGDRLCMTTSMADAVLLDVALGVAPNLEVVFLDTQYHFPETWDMVRTVRERYAPNLRVMRPAMVPDDRWKTDTESCCAIRKVAQLDAALVDKDAWMSGLRRADSFERRATPIVHRDRRGLVKVNPLATWTDEQIDDYIASHEVPVNDLLRQGFTSVGCWPCTRAVAPGEDRRAGRWSGSGRSECGLHL